MQYLYVIKCQEYFKIGIANDVETRLAQLSTGNPYPLEVEVVYQFENAEVVERAIHQKYKTKRVRGKWFNLDYDDQKDIHTICKMLGASAFEYTGENPTNETIEDAEEYALPVGGKFDYAAMFADGWRMEKQTNGRNVGEGCRYWGWRRGSKNPKEYIYGGTLASLPYPIEEMCKMFDGLPVSDL